MFFSGVAVTVCEDAKGFDASDGVFDANTETGLGVIIAFFVFGQRVFSCGFVGDVDGGVVVLIALIAAIGVGSGVFRKRRAAPPDRNIVHCSRCGF